MRQLTQSIKMKSRSELLIKVLIEQLGKIHARCIALASDVTLVDREDTVPIGLPVISTTMSPTADQLNKSQEIYKSHVSWVDLVTVFIARFDSEMSSSFKEISSSYSSYIALNRVGHNIEHDAWRNSFTRESNSLAMAQADMIVRASDSFKIIDTRKKRSFKNFDIRIKPAKSISDGVYNVSTRFSDDRTRHSTLIRYDQRDIDKLARSAVLQRPRTRKWAPSDVKPLVDFGSSLYQNVLDNESSELLSRAREICSSKAEILRIRIDLSECPNLASIPWEVLHDGVGFLGLSSIVSIVRHFSSQERSAAEIIKPPLRILVSISRAMGDYPLAHSEERKKLTKALEPLSVLGLIRLDFAPDGSLITLQRMLRSAEHSDSPYHVWHFIGHGTYNSSEDTSFLIFEKPYAEAVKDESGNEKFHLVNGFDLGSLFSGYPQLRLALLNACEGARSNNSDYFAGVATSLIERGVPAVVAMQFDISDEAAIIFAEEFYCGIVDGLPVEGAVTESRRAILAHQNRTEWVTPVLFRSSGDPQYINTSEETEEWNPENIFSEGI